MAVISVSPDNIDRTVWWMMWTERDEVIGQIVEEQPGHFVVIPEGPHWNPMKSFAGKDFGSASEAIDEINVYFRDR